MTLTDLRLAAEQHNIDRLKELIAVRAERFELMARLALLPSDMIFFTQITMEAAEDPEFLDAMHAAKIKDFERVPNPAILVDADTIEDEDVLNRDRVIIHPDNL